MRIAIEAQRIFRPNKHGMDIVALESIRQLQKIDTVNEYYILVSPGSDRCLEDSANFRIIEVDVPTYPLWEQFALPLAVERINPDILHCTSNTAPIFCKVPLVVTLHDIIFMERHTGSNASAYQRMGRIYRRLVVPRIIGKCRKIITVSCYEAERIESFFHLDSVKVIYNSCSEHFYPIENYTDVTKKYLPESRYIFFLGNTDPKKNMARTLKGYSIYLEQSQERLPLLICDTKREYVAALLHSEGIEDIMPHIRFSGYIPNCDLPSVYSGAQTFLYTSLRESFGIPLLEAMACGVPIVTSDTSSMPEIALDAALFVDPTDVGQIGEALLLMERDEALRQSKIEAGLERVKNFSWRTTAQKMLETYNQIVNEPQK